jgi:hypothetical protein
MKLTASAMDVPGHEADTSSSARLRHVRRLFVSTHALRGRQLRGLLDGTTFWRRMRDAAHTGERSPAPYTHRIRAWRKLSFSKPITRPEGSSISTTSSPVSSDTYSVLTLDCGHREQTSRCADEELGVQQCSEDRVAALGVETEQALRLQGRQPETRHLEVFRADSPQQVWKCRVQTRTRGEDGPPFRKESV